VGVCLGGGGRWTAAAQAWLEMGGMDRLTDGWTDGRIADGGLWAVDCGQW